MNYNIALVIIIYILLINWAYEFYVKNITHYALSDINWDSNKSIYLYVNLFNKLGPPDLIDKENGGSAVWESWRKKCKIILYDKEEHIISGIFPIKLFAGYINVVISKEAIDKMIFELNKVCYPSFCTRNKIQIRSNSWDSLMESACKSMQITSGEKDVSFDVEYIDNYICKYI